MTLIAFTRNYQDRSNDRGYQFEFFCDKCGNGVRSSYEASTMGMAAGLLRAASSFLGGALDRAAYGAESMKDALRGEGWDKAYAAAVEEARPRFRHCTRCGRWVCPESCWNEQRSLCESCAPDLGEEAAAQQAQAAAEQVAQKMRQVDQVSGVNAAAHAMAACPHCGAHVGSGKFCAECGKPLVAAPTSCGQCGTEIPGKAKFCPECGAARA